MGEKLALAAARNQTPDRAGGDCGATARRPLSCEDACDPRAVPNSRPSYHKDVSMKLSRVLLLALALGAFALPSSAGVVGKTLPAIELEGFAQTKARSLDDFVGRGVLIEFFAYW